MYTCDRAAFYEGMGGVWENSLLWIGLARFFPCSRNTLDLHEGQVCFTPVFYYISAQNSLPMGGSQPCMASVYTRAMNNLILIWIHC